MARWSSLALACGLACAAVSAFASCNTNGGPCPAATQDGGPAMGQEKRYYACTCLDGRTGWMECSGGNYTDCDCTNPFVPAGGADAAADGAGAEGGPADGG